MNVLIIGSGGREHAMGWKIAQSPDCGRLFFAPGNGGTASLGENVDINIDDIHSLADFAERNDAFTVVGPEQPLSLGIVDTFRARKLPIFGPDRNAAQLESSKAFAKAFMNRHGIPTAEYTVFDDPDAAEAALTPPTRSYPLVLKADGLAAGKGVVIARNETEARQALQSMMRDDAFAGAGRRVVMEEYMEGPEVSLLCLTDGQTILPLDSAGDYKRAMDQDEGLNTGGMGSVSPAFGYTPGMADDIVKKTLSGIRAEGFDYRGVLYIGLMLTAQGPKVVEYNARFGDPETEALLPRLETDLLSVMRMTEEQRLHEVLLRWKPEPSVCVMLVSGGYPSAYTNGKMVTVSETDATLFHAGTTLRNGELITNGGRVIAVTALGADRETARANAYAAVKKIHFDNCYFRSDIGKTV